MGKKKNAVQTSTTASVKSQEAATKQVVANKKPESSTPAPSPPSVAAPPAADPVIRNEAQLKEVEGRERDIILEALYKSELNKLEKRPDFAIPHMTTKEKLTGFKKFSSMLSDPTNARVMRVFLMVTCSMFSLPIVGLYIGSSWIGPLLGVDGDLAGAVTAVAVVLVIMFGYVFYALAEDEMFNADIQEQKRDELKKKQAAAPATTGKKVQKAKVAPVDVKVKKSK